MIIEIIQIKYNDYIFVLWFGRLTKKIYEMR